MKEVGTVRGSFLEEVRHPGPCRTSRDYRGMRENKQEERGSENESRVNIKIERE